MEIMESRIFANGFESWHETHYEIVSMLTLEYERGNSIVTDYMETNGTGGMYELAKDLTELFEIENKLREWDGEYFEEIEHFFYTELNKLSKI